MEQVRQRYEAYCEARERESHRAYPRRPRAVALGEIDERFADLTSGEALEQLREASGGRDSSALTEARWRMLALLEQAVLEARTRALDREFETRERAQCVRIGSREHPLDEAQWLLSTESDRERRREIEAAIGSAWDELDELRCERFVRTAEVRKALGYTTGRERAEALHPGVDFERWAIAAGRLLQATESAYRDRLLAALARLGVQPGEASRGDAAHLERASEFDSQFPAGRFAACLEFTIQGMGVHVSEPAGLGLDAEPRPGNSADPRCFPIRVPGEVVLSLGRPGGVCAHRAGFAEAARALHYAFTSPELPVERRRGGDAAPRTAWALLLGERLADRQWIEESPARQWAAEFEREAALRSLLALRRCAGRVRFELELSALPAGTDPHALASRYAEELSAATGAAHEPAGYLVAGDPELSSVAELRAWCLEAQLAEHLRERFGRRFWKQRGAGELAKELWNTGSTYAAEALANALGIGPLDVEFLIESWLGRG